MLNALIKTREIVLYLRDTHRKGCPGPGIQAGCDRSCIHKESCTYITIQPRRSLLIVNALSNQDLTKMMKRTLNMMFVKADIRIGYGAVLNKFDMYFGRVRFSL